MVCFPISKRLHGVVGSFTFDEYNLAVPTRVYRRGAAIQLLEMNP